MTKIVQEKFQVNEPLKPASDHQWATDKSARTIKNRQTKDGMNRYESYRAGLNRLPPGSNIEDQEVAHINDMRTVTAGTSDVTDNPSGSDFSKGFVKLPLRPTDDMYTREHQDAFYDDVTVDGSTGYLERNNMLDRS